MAERQTKIDFPLLEAEASAAERERANELAARLRSIDPAAAGVSPLAWQRVSELVMAAWTTTTTTTKTPTAAHLSRDQHDRARRTAQRLGLLRITRRYQHGKRLSDAVDVDVGRVDALVALTRAGPERSRTSQCAQLRPTAPNPCAQVRPSAPKLHGDLLFFLHPVNTSSSSSLSRKADIRQEEVEEEILIFLAKVRRLLPAPLRLDEAVAAALAAGVTLDELRARCRWFLERQVDWPAEHRPGVLFVGLRNARSGMPADRGWPYRR